MDGGITIRECVVLARFDHFVLERLPVIPSSSPVDTYDPVARGPDPDPIS